MDALFRLYAVLLVLGLLGLLWWFAKRMKSGAGALRVSLPKSNLPGKLWRDSEKPVELAVLQRVHLTSSHQLHLVRNGGQRVLICTHPQGCSLLTTGGCASREEINLSEVEMFSHARNGR